VGEEKLPPPVLRGLSTSPGCAGGLVKYIFFWPWFEPLVVYKDSGLWRLHVQEPDWTGRLIRPPTSCFLGTCG